MATTFGEVVRRGDVFDLAYERVYATGVEDVWSAVTQRDRLERWMARYDGELGLGGSWEVKGDDGEVFVRGTVTRCEPPHRYVTTWHWVGEPETTITVTVREHPEGALLRLEHAGLEDAKYGPGWQTYLEQLDEQLPPAASSVVDPARAPGTGWGERFATLAEAWEPLLGVAPTSH